MIFPKEKGEFIFPIADGRIKTLGGDHDLRTSTLVRERPIRGEGHVDFLGESEGSLPQPQDSFLDAGEAINDFWSMSGNFIYRHHVEPRVKLYSPREESFPIPLKYIDVSRTTHTNLDVKEERRIDGYWNIDGSRDLSDYWTGFTQFTLMEEKSPDGKMWSGVRLKRKQQTSRPDHLWPELWKSMGKNAKLKEKQKWSEEKLHLENERKLRGIYFIDPEDTEFKETIKNARKKLETSVVVFFEWKRELGSEVGRQPEGEVARQIKSSQPTQPTPSPIRDRSGRPDDLQDGRNTSLPQEINVNSFNEGLSSSDRTERPVVSEDMMSLNVEQTHDRTGRPVATLHTVVAQEDSQVCHEADTLNVDDEVLRERMEKSVAVHGENHEPMMVRQTWTSEFQDYHIPL